MLLKDNDHFTCKLAKPKFQLRKGKFHLINYIYYAIIWNVLTTFCTLENLQTQPYIKLAACNLEICITINLLNYIKSKFNWLWTNF